VISRYTQAFGYNRHVPKICARLCSVFWVREWELGPHATQCHFSQGLSAYRVACRCIQPFGHNRNGPKMGLWFVLGRGPLSSCSTTYLNVRPPPWQVISLSMQPFRENTHGPKIAKELYPIFGEGTGCPCNTKSVGLKSIYI